MSSEAPPPRPTTRPTTRLIHFPILPDHLASFQATYAPGPFAFLTSHPACLAYLVIANNSAGDLTSSTVDVRATSLLTWRTAQDAHAASAGPVFAEIAAPVREHLSARPQFLSDALLACHFARLGESEESGSGGGSGKELQGCPASLVQFAVKVAEEQSTREAVEAFVEAYERGPFALLKEQVAGCRMCLLMVQPEEASAVTVVVWASEEDKAKATKLQVLQEARLAMQKHVAQPPRVSVGRVLLAYCEL